MTPRILSWVGLSLAGLVFFATNVSADVRLAVNRDGVSLIARQATIREILEEWTKVAGTTFVGIEHLPSDAVTLDLRGVSERDALDILLRSASGYIIMPAAADASIQSKFGWVLVVATSTARADALAWRPPVTGPVESTGERRRTENVVDVVVDPVPDPAPDEVIVAAPESTVPADPTARARAASGRLAPGSMEPAGLLGLPAGVAPGEPIGDPSSRPGLVPAWLQESGSTGAPSGRVTAPGGTATPGAAAPLQIRAPGPRDSLTDRSPVPPAPVSAPSN